MTALPATVKNNLLESYAMLQCKVKAQQRIIEDFQNGKRFLKLQADQKRVIAGYIRNEKRLQRELAEAHAETQRVLDIWSKQCAADWEDYQKELAKKDAENQKLNEKYWNLVKKTDEQLAEKDAVIEALMQELAHKDALLTRDSTNTNLPTSQTPPGKNKHIPNSRIKTGKKRGGQPGHEKHALEKPDEGEINDIKEQGIADGESCPSCGSNDFHYTGEYRDKFEYDVKIEVIKRRTRYFQAECNQCGKTFMTSEAPKFEDEAHYGPNVDAIALSLMNNINAPMNKVPMLFTGMTGGQICPSEAYMAKLQKRAADNLRTFRDDLRKLLITQHLLYWDDTVIWANKKRICLRFYGTEDIAFYVVHEKKNMEGIQEDNILPRLTKETRVMHDHNTINYNRQFVFINLECNAHLERDLKKIFDETKHEALIEIKNLISQTIKDRNDLVNKGESAFNEAYKETFTLKLSALLTQAKTDAEANKSQYSASEEKALVARIIKYRANYFAWVYDFSLPVTNNLAERALRGAKTKMKVAGQFFSVETGDYHALIRTYTETCRRRGVNEMEALARLSQGNPYTASELFN